ncbi:MAG: alpha-glucuronidase, partial [Moraxellaceae bacterium]
MRKFKLIIIVGYFLASFSYAEDGYDMWLRYQPIVNNALKQEYQTQLRHIVAEGNSPTIKVAVAELQRGFAGLLNTPTSLVDSVNNLGDGSVIIGTPENSKIIASLNVKKILATVGSEGYAIKKIRIGAIDHIVIAANNDIGVLYGTYHLLRLIQTEKSLQSLDIVSAPKLQHRVVNHWDNVNRLVERGYAGLSLWDWGTLPEFKNPRYT